MTYEKLKRSVTFVMLCMFMAASGNAQQSSKMQHTPKAGKSASTAAALTFQPGLEPRAIDILKGTSARLAAAKSMTFTAVVSYESPSRLGPPLVYSTRSEVTMQRPDKLKVITPGDGPASEFYYNGKTMTAFAPAENLVAVADAPPTIDAALEAAYNTGAIYFPFTDVIVADPWKDIADGLKIAFYVGQSSVVGGTTTDIVAYVTGDVFVQVWIGADDRLPRRIYAIYLNDRVRLRHVLELSNWQLDVSIPANAFDPAGAVNAARIAFARPDAGGAPGMKPPPKMKPARTQ
ncbi:DUF2092 domain-containing protein [Paraburkholderia sp. GAS42]|uniref:DUF2092 domain-containing protein n=1 Tax=Paraburkholderia sp. GAS42 TaxID=3035135 RepID=UPI003D23AF23